MNTLLSYRQRFFLASSFYVLFGMLYWGANSLQTNFESNFWREAIVDYTLKALLTFPIWWFLFRYLKDRSLSTRLLFHIIMCPLYVFSWFSLFRVVANYFQLFYLKGTGAVWDVYIPTLFYCLQFGFFHAYEYWENYQNQLQREETLKELARASEINGYKAQLQPHFLFNTLNSINATLTSENEATREMIAKLADTFRYALNISEKEFIPLKEELAFNKNCLELEQIRFSDRLKISYDIDTSLLENLVPPMILQPIIENAIKHGISKSISGGTITIAIQKEHDFIVFTITDTGVGLGVAAENSNGIGLSNTQKRLKILYGESLLVLENKPNGVKVVFKIPIKKHNGKN